MAAVKYNPMVLKQLVKDGWFPTTTDYWDAFTRRTKDLYTCIDVIGIGKQGTIAVQVTSRSNMASRRKKVLAAEAFPHMQDAGWIVEVWGYDQPKGKGTRYRLKREQLAGPVDPPDLKEFVCRMRCCYPEVRDWEHDERIRDQYR